MNGLEKREYFLLQESKDIYGIPPETVRKWVKRSGAIPPLRAYRPGVKLMIKRKDMELYIKQFAVV